MTGRSDFGSRPWRFPALLSYAPATTMRRGTQQDILRALRHLLLPPAPRHLSAVADSDRVAPSGGDSGRAQ